MSQVTAHVLDTARGRPAAGVPVRLLRLVADREEVLATSHTDDDGRVGDLGPDQVAPGSYRLVFDVAAYAATTGQDCFFPEVALTFAVRDESHHHVPLLLSPFAYSTYRGS
ncbi:hydroxyisourate hydrolase [Nocardioides antri]|uniref:5-hydroxyisourate hydrolase n=1 Tax=Nocardioides antri TaxID=2607659 RepID=A0A5B1M0W7_9ACTN|nr:hydroxyisourate hydrolase [Nocardioides antri]KAA1426573.1 hydroxyisourate hydrolase [Nocardioides antri]